MNSGRKKRWKSLAKEFNMVSIENILCERRASYDTRNAQRQARTGGCEAAGDALA